MRFSRGASFLGLVALMLGASAIANEARAFTRAEGWERRMEREASHSSRVAPATGRPTRPYVPRQPRMTYQPYRWLPSSPSYRARAPRTENRRYQYQQRFYNYGNR